MYSIIIIELTPQRLLEVVRDDYVVGFLQLPIHRRRDLVRHRLALPQGDMAQLYDTTLVPPLVNGQFIYRPRP